MWNYTWRPVILMSRFPSQYATYVNGQESFSLSTIPGPDFARRPRGGLRQRRCGRQERSAGAAQTAATATSSTTVARSLPSLLPALLSSALLLPTATLNSPSLLLMPTPLQNLTPREKPRQKHFGVFRLSSAARLRPTGKH